MTEIKKEIIEKLRKKSAVIGIIGLGYVGLPLMLRFTNVGFKVIGIDIDQSKVDSLNSKQSYIEHISNELISEAVNAGFEATTDFSKARQIDVLILCVPTPLNNHREPDLTYILSTMDALVPFLRTGHVISLESTTYPGTTEEEVLPRLEKAGLVAGKTAFLIYSPEREDPGNPEFKTRTIPKICSGHTKACLEVGIALYKNAVDKVVAVSSTKTAEMTKLLENIHRAVNIGLVNELKIVADKMGINIHEVISAAATKPFGFTPFYPGPGLGGHCIPIDPFYLTWKAREFGLNTRFIELAGEVNTKMPEWVIGKTSDALNQRGKPLKGSSFLVLGIAYKKNVDDMRESPSVALMELLKEKGAQVQYSDPHIPVFPKLRGHFFELSSVELTPEIIESFDCVMLATDHDAFDYDLIRLNARLIIDTRGRYKEPDEHIIRA